MTPILEVRGLSIAFRQYEAGTRQRSLPVIRDLSLTVGAGQIVAVVGSSGSGKSLLAHGILHILPYNSCMQGEMRFCGMPLTAERAASLRGREMVLVPQGVTYLDPLMRVGRKCVGGQRTARARPKCREVLARYGLDADTENLYPFELSGGMARRGYSSRPPSWKRPGSSWQTSPRPAWMRAPLRGSWGIFGNWPMRAQAFCSSRTIWSLH